MLALTFHTVGKESKLSFYNHWNNANKVQISTGKMLFISELACNAIFGTYLAKKKFYLCFSFKLLLKHITVKLKTILHQLHKNNLTHD